LPEYQVLRARLKRAHGERRRDPVIMSRPITATVIAPITLDGPMHPDRTYDRGCDFITGKSSCCVGSGCPRCLETSQWWRVWDSNPRGSARWMVTQAQITAIAQISRDDIEDYKVWLAAKHRSARPRRPPGPRAPPRAAADRVPRCNSAMRGMTGGGILANLRMDDRA
jgi:hypothetical protein